MPRFIGHYLATGSNPKIIKGDDDHYITAIQHFLPSDLSGHQMCGMEKIAGCRKDCLNTAGRGQSPMVVAARMRKTIEFAEHRPLYNYLIDKDLVKYETFCHRHELHGSVRMGGTDDRPWHQILKMEAYDLQFYNYTKHWRRAYHRLPKNYHLTLSYSEADKGYARDILKASKDTGTNIAVVFKGDFPKRFKGLPVIDGTKDDLRFLDPSPCAVALKPLGKAKHNTNGFVVAA
jgi:hypothetical protein